MSQYDGLVLQRHGRAGVDIESLKDSVVKQSVPRQGNPALTFAMRIASVGPESLTDSVVGKSERLQGQFYSGTPFYKVLLPYFSVQPTTILVLLRTMQTTKYYSVLLNTTPYYKV